jgi:CRISPR type I-E-associated protein CasB/Cse2
MSGTTRAFDEGMAKVASTIDAARGARKGGSFLSPGDVADLRRMDVARPPSAFWRLMSTFVPEGVRRGDETERRWALACRCMAIMAPNAHQSDIRPGEALASSGFASEDRPLRINRLLRADGEAFEDLLQSACIFLASRARPVNWRSLGKLAVYRDDDARRELARDFFSAALIRSAS